MTMQRWRTLSRVILVLLVTAHLITRYAMGIQVVGSIGIEALFAGLSRGVINTGFVFWMLVFASALLLGRAFCGWFCWFGGYQELVAWGIGDRSKIKIPRRVSLYLGVIPFLSRGIKVYYTWIVNWLEGVSASFSFNLANVEPWGGQQTGVSILITLVLYGPVGRNQLEGPGQRDEQSGQRPGGGRGGTTSMRAETSRRMGAWP